MAKSVIQTCFELLLIVIKDHFDNQLYVADYIAGTIIHHAVVEPLAGKVIEEVLRENRTVQDRKIHVREIKIIADKILEKDMNVMFLGLLQSCCSCAGKGVTKNQSQVAKVVFEGNHNFFFNIEADYDSRTMLDALSTSPSKVELSGGALMLSSPISSGGGLLQRLSIDVGGGSKDSFDTEALVALNSPSKRGEKGGSFSGSFSLKRSFSGFSKKRTISTDLNDPEGLELAAMRALKKVEGMMRAHLMDLGYPALSVSWIPHSEQFSASKLFFAPNVVVNELFRGTVDLSSSSSPKVMGLQEMRMMTAKIFYHANLSCG